MSMNLTTACFGLTLLAAPALAGPGFDVVTLGATGGMQDGNLSAYLIHPHGDPRGVTCDAGSIVNGIHVAAQAGAFDALEIPDDSKYTPVGHVLTDVIRGYFISHAHLDHIAGLVIGSPEDSAKPIYGLPSVLANIEATYFNWKAWPNFGTTGAEPHLGKYAYAPLTPNETRDIDNTAMQVTTFALSHGGTESTAFLFEANGDALLCFGDTGPDSVEGSDAMSVVWKAAAEHVTAGTLKGIIIESSYTSERPDNLLFGHLTPKYILEGLQELATLAGRDTLDDLPVIISHVKYQITKGETPQVQILKELEDGNTFNARFLMPQQGDAWHFE